MPHESRRAARAAAEQQKAAAVATQQDRRRKRVRTTWLIIAIVLIVLLGLACWVGFRALTVKNGLEASQRLIAEVQNGADVKETISEISEHAESAAAAASDPVWAVLEFIPVAGDNLRGVRLAAQSLDALVNDVALPVLNASDEGRGLIPQVMTVAQSESERISRLADEIAVVQKSTALVGPVRKGVDQVAEVTAAAAPALELLPDLLGADGPRNYLLVFQNNAETLALGGSAASQSIVHVDNGNIEMGGQGNSGTYQNGVAVDVEVDQSALDLYSSYLVDHVNTSMSRPDFPTAAQIMRAWWQRDMAPDEIDGVISIDPLALSRILVATGPIELPTGDTLSSDNAVSLLLKDVYERWDSYAEPEVVDGFFAAAAGAVFDKVASGDFNLKDMLWAVSESASRGSILVWSEDEDITDAIAGQRVSGILPTDNVESTTLGMYFQNTNASKIDYYMESQVSAEAVCTGGTGTFTITGQLTLDLDQQTADRLPRYVKSYVWGSKQFRDWIYVYGPPGTTVESATVDGREVRVMQTEATDLGRPVASFETFLKPGESATISATFTGEGDFGPLAVQTNPMIRQADGTVTDGCSG